MKLVRCDKCGEKTAPLDESIMPPQFPIGWARVNIVLFEELYPKAEKQARVRGRLTPDNGPAVQVDIDMPPMGVAMPSSQVPIVSNLDFCPDCAELFFRASGCDEKIRREPE